MSQGNKMEYKWSELLFNRRWRGLLFLLVVTLVVDGVGIRWLGVSVYITRWQDAWGSLVFFAGMTLFTWGLHRSGLFRMARSQQLLQRCTVLFYSMSYIQAFGTAIGILSYLSVKLQMPLVDNQLALADQWLGFSWLGYFNWVEAHHWISSALFLAYRSPSLQTLVTLLFCCFLARPRQLEEFLGILALAVLACIAIAGYFPAHGAFFTYGKPHTPGALSISDFFLLHQGQMQRINLDHLQGIIQMPSFHTCMAIIFTYAVRSCRYLLIPALLLNAVMLLSTPYCGGHYLMDMLAATLLMVVVIGVVRHWRQSDAATSQAPGNAPLCLSKGQAGC